MDSVDSVHRPSAPAFDSVRGYSGTLRTSLNGMFRPEKGQPL